MLFKNRNFYEVYYNDQPQHLFIDMEVDLKKTLNTMKERQE